ncbi:ATP/GTP-binding protein [Nocardiopsis sp. MG754419]|uniref:GTP-binding protein n=1 Tax=Nocardiopsis sp. MG754419 TaxID=2259865 RepID=UPI001BA94B0B|nr:ATP/GTP-binding protein [Nocardiopsis sp. MG754419]MBR8743725.1 ATP/GTP-binding protein [Nocardiopsis sp. MG754419]
MHSTTSEPPSPATVVGTPTAPLPDSASQALKIAVVGGFGVGKTTMVRSVSEIRPLTTEETMTRAGAEIDDLRGVEGKNTTTVAFDFGRITLDSTSVLYLFGAPGQQRFWFLWDRLFTGALGAVVLVDTRRLEDCFYAIDRLEAQGTPFVVAHNDFGEADHALEDVRSALDLDPSVPLMRCDARERGSAKDVLIRLAEHVRTLVREGRR